MSLTLCVLLWAHDGQESALASYEDRMLELLEPHGVELLQRARSSGHDGEPLEVQLYRFPSEESFNGFMGDERRVALEADRQKVIAKTQIMRVELV